MRGAEAGVEVGAGEREGGRRGAEAGAGVGGRGVEAAGAATRTFRSGSSLEILSSSCILLWPRSGRGALEAFVASFSSFGICTNHQILINWTNMTRFWQKLKIEI